jgi:hypothetical protein
MKTLDEAREQLQEVVKAGGKAPICPCCEQRVKFYRRNIYSGMAVIVLTLNKMYQCDPKLDWIHVREFPQMKRNGFNINSNYSFLRHWGLLEQHVERTGYWRLTQLGRDFAEGKATVNKYIYLLNGIKVGEAGKAVTVREALGKKFNLEEVLNATLPAIA